LYRYKYSFMSIIGGMKVSIGQAAKELGVSIPTLRRWEAEGKIQAERTPKGHRRYDLAQLRGLKPYETSKTNRPTVCYARVSSHDQKEELVRQVALLETFCAANGWSYEIVQDLGSGLNYNKRGLQQLIKRICSGTVGRLVLTNKDRLLRFGSELIFSLCEAYNTEVVLINQGEQPMSCEEELAEDVLEIITVFSARLYGSRSQKNRKLVETLREVAEQL
jgi:putative resolvase